MSSSVLLFVGAVSNNYFLIEHSASFGLKVTRTTPLGVYMHALSFVQRSHISIFSEYEVNESVHLYW